MEKAFWKAEETELLITWLMPHQQMRPDTANSTAMTEYRPIFPPRFSLTKLWI